MLSCSSAVTFSEELNIAIFDFSQLRITLLAMIALFGWPIIYIDMNSQCYFIHRHPRISWLLIMNYFRCSCSYRFYDRLTVRMDVTAAILPWTWMEVQQNVIFFGGKGKCLISIHCWLSLGLLLTFHWCIAFLIFDYKTNKLIDLFNCCRC